MKPDGTERGSCVPQAGRSQSRAATGGRIRTALVATRDGKFGARSLMFPPHRDPRAAPRKPLRKKDLSHIVHASARPRYKPLGEGVSHGAQQTTRRIHRAHGGI